MRKQSRVLKGMGNTASRESQVAGRAGSRPASVGKAAAQETKTSTRKFSAEDYREAAKSYRDEGRDDLAKLAENKASEIEVEDRKEQEEKVKGELKSAWDKNLYEEVEG
jgi:hypothetical protein